MSRPARRALPPAVLLVAACGGGVPTAAPVAAAAPAPALDAGAPAPAPAAMERGVHLVRDFFEAEHTYRLDNGGPGAITGLYEGSDLAGHFERSGLDGTWFDHFVGDRSYAVVDPTGPLAAGASLHVSEVPWLGGHARVLSPGRYRFVLPYRATGAPEGKWQVVLPFTVEGLDAAESGALFDALQRPEARACPPPQRWPLLTVIEETAAPEALPRLLDLPVSPGDTLASRLAPLEVLARFPEQSGRVIAVVEHGDAATAVPAAIALLRESDCPLQARRCGAAVTRLAATLGERGEPLPETIDALATAHSLWPPAVPGLLLDRLHRTRSDDLRSALAHALARGGRERLGPRAPEAVTALRLAADRTREVVVHDLLLEAASLLSPPVDDSASHGGGGWGSPIGAGPGVSPPACLRFLAGLGALLRFSSVAGAGRRSLEVTYGVSSVEPYREPVRE